MNDITLPQGKASKKEEKEAEKLKKASEKAAKIAIKRAEIAAQIAASNADFVANVEKEYKNIEGSIIWDATLDRETRSSHGLMDGKKRNSDGLFDGPGECRTPYPGWAGLPPEERDGCRCTLRFEIKGESPQFRRTREDGVIPYINWLNWAKSKGWTKSKGWPKDEDNEGK